MSSTAWHRQEKTETLGISRTHKGRLSNFWSALANHHEPAKRDVLLELHDLIYCFYLNDLATTFPSLGLMLSLLHDRPEVYLP